MDLDSPKDDQLINVQEDEDEEVNAKKDGAKQVHAEEPKETEDASGQVSSIQAKIKTLDALLSLLSKVTKALHRFTKVVEKASHKASDQGVPSADQAVTHPAEGRRTQNKLQSFSYSNKELKKISPKSPPQPEGELIKKDKGKKAVSSKDAGKEGEHIHLTANQIKEQKRLKEIAKAEMAKKEEELVKEELIDLLGFDVVYREDEIDEVILDLKSSDLHLSKLREIDFSKPFSEQDPLDKLNDLARKKRKHVDDIHDYFRSTKKFKSSVQYEDHPARTVLNNPCLEIFFRLYQGHVIDDHARTFSFFLLAKVGKRNLNPLKQMRTIKKLR
ncbi:hypothetical protein Tco_1025854 [Tanacetum coccineum]